MGKLSERLLVHPTSVTSTVDTLQRLGFVRRVPHPTDRRRRWPGSPRRAGAPSRPRSAGMADAGCGVGVLSNAQARTEFKLLAKVRLQP